MFITPHIGGATEETLAGAARGRPPTPIADDAGGPAAAAVVNPEVFDRPQAMQDGRP